ncbi:MAG TPA: CheR family methyltransferase [Syntrophales bacterium]|nr:CheR family methyltransferase [Syntrophales bacterium]
MNDDQFRQILDYFGMSWPGYRKVRKGVIKRLVRHMQKENVRDACDYMQRIRTQPALQRETRRLLTVSISSFFRDRFLWKYLGENLLPELLSQKPARVNVWSAGCALGQEAYSFVMLWRLLSDVAGPLPPLFLLATDMNREYLETAASGFYTEKMLKEVPEDCLDRFFQFENDCFVIRKDLRDGISWLHHDLSDVLPVQDPFHIIFMRNNLLTYCRKETHQVPVKRVVDRLIAGGSLIVGARERLSCDDFGLSGVCDCPGVYRKI